jgi:hypothetical protein
MAQVDDLQAGDIVLFIEGEDLSGPLPDTMGFVVNDCPDPYDEPACLIQFYAGDDFPASPLHYYRHELRSFLELGSIRIQHAS